MNPRFKFPEPRSILLSHRGRYYVFLIMCPYYNQKPASWKLHYFILEYQLRCIIPSILELLFIYLRHFTNIPNVSDYRYVSTEIVLLYIQVVLESFCFVHMLPLKFPWSVHCKSYPIISTTNRSENLKCSNNFRLESIRSKALFQLIQDEINYWTFVLGTVFEMPQPWGCEMIQVLLLASKPPGGLRLCSYRSYKGCYLVGTGCGDENY